MLVGLLLLLSGALIGAGAALVLRDWLQRKRMSFLPARPGQERTVPAEEAEITIARVGARSTARDSFLPQTDTQATTPEAVAMGGLRERDAMRARHVQPVAPAPKPIPVEPARSQEPEPTVVPAADQNILATLSPAERARLWSELHVRVAHALERAQARSSARGLEIDTVRQQLSRGAGDESGATFPVLIAEREEGWLRLELDFDGYLSARMTMLSEQAASEHSIDRRLAPGQQTDADIDRLVADCLAPLCARAAAELTRRAKVTALNSRDLDASSSSLASESGTRVASERAWLETAPALAAALRATNGAFTQVDTRLIEIGKAQWDPAQRRHRLTLALMVAGEDAARVHVDRLPHELEISLAGIDAGTEVGSKELGRRRRVPADGITVQALAELVAGCVWPTIARIRDRRSSARPA